MDRTPEFMQKTGTFDCDIVEANPVVWKGRLLIGQYIRYGRDRAGDVNGYPSKSYYANEEVFSYFRFYEPATGQIFGKIAPGLHMGNAFVDGDKIIVSCVECWGGSKFYQTESTDLVNWTEPRVIIDDPAMAGYNTSVCKTDNGYMMVFELGKPTEKVGVPFTMFFAYSKDLQNWEVVKDGCFGKDFYTGGPMLRYHNGYYYIFYLNGSYEDGFETYVARSADLKNWKISDKNPALGYGENDYKLAADFPMSEAGRVKVAKNINASDLDMCEYNGNLEFIYAWGDQRGTEFLARAVAPGMTEAAFCESFFK